MESDGTTLPENVRALLVDPGLRAALRRELDFQDLRANLQGIADRLIENCEGTTIDPYASGLARLFSGWINGSVPISYPPTFACPDPPVLELQGALLPPFLISSVVLMLECVRRMYSGEPVNLVILDVIQGTPLKPGLE
jgi:hypothetical protein